jgi:pimeloyl-ACP methyl ester carboxylesterase
LVEHRVDAPGAQLDAHDELGLEVGQLALPTPDFHRLAQRVPPDGLERWYGRSRWDLAAPLRLRVDATATRIHHPVAGHGSVVGGRPLGPAARGPAAGGNVGTSARQLRSTGEAAGPSGFPTTAAAPLAGLLTELTWAGAHMLTYLSGIHAERFRPGDCAASGTPILLAHGLNDNRSVFMVMRHKLRRSGFTSVCCWNYSPLSDDVPRLAADLGRHIGRIRAQTGHERVHVVGHSLGGLIARYHVQRQGGDRSIESLVTLGTPHQGTALAYLLPTRLGRQLRPGSSIVRELLRAPADRRGCRLRRG